MRERRHRLPNSSLKKIPIAKYRKGDPYETCAICLEDFVEEEKLRVLPCSHGKFNCKLIVAKISLKFVRNNNMSFANLEFLFNLLNSNKNVY